MHRPGHYGMALILYSPIAAVVLALGFEKLALLGGVVAVLGAMVPDLDERVSFVAHRGPTHTIWFAFLVGSLLGICGVLLGARDSLAVAVTLGAFGAIVGTVTVVAHLLADALTPAGIRPFVPVQDTRYTLQVTGAANPRANYLLLAAGIAGVTGAILVGHVIGGW